MEIRYMNDLHLEVSGRGDTRRDPRFSLPVGAADRERVLVLAGDIDVDARAVDLALRMAPEFRAVVQILGNHEYYRWGSPQRLPVKLHNRVVEAGAANVHVLENGAVDVGGVRFIGATLWTDFNAGDAAAMYDARNVMNDFRRIRYGPSGAPYAHRFLPRDARFLHRISRDFIEQAVGEAHDVGRTPVVVTHHAPYPPAGPNGPPLSFSYGSDLAALIERCRPSLWIHGHTHESVDTWIGSTRVVSNPRGYAGIEPVEEFDVERRVAVPSKGDSSVGDSAGNQGTGMQGQEDG
jgi:predicted phosphohydrolase